MNIDRYMALARKRVADEANGRLQKKAAARKTQESTVEQFWKTYYNSLRLLFPDVVLRYMDPNQNAHTRNTLSSEPVLNVPGCLPIRVTLTLRSDGRAFFGNDKPFYVPGLCHDATGVHIVDQAVMDADFTPAHVHDLDHALVMAEERQRVFDKFFSVLKVRHLSTAKTEPHYEPVDHDL